MTKTTKRKPEPKDAIKSRQDAYKERQQSEGMARVTPAFYVPNEHRKAYLNAINEAGKKAIKKLNKSFS